MTTHPNVHRCGLRDLSYEQVDEGTIWCRECGRIYDLVTTWSEDGKPLKKWMPDPKPPMTESQKAAQRAKFAGGGKSKFPKKPLRR